jgi:transcriptional regulator with XRE-family HTH domain
MRLKGSTVADHRRLLGLTQVQLAERVGVSEQTIVAWERGATTLPQPERLATLARALGLEIRDLVALDATDSPASAVAPQPGTAPAPAAAPAPVGAPGAGATDDDTEDVA